MQKLPPRPFPTTNITVSFSFVSSFDLVESEELSSRGIDSSRRELKP